jgi:sulfatase maturation enzyme AslB (radical SAM superfamily)
MSELTFEDIVENYLTYTIHDKKDNLCDDCLECKYMRMCRSGCIATHDENGKTIWCEGLKLIFGFIESRLREIQLGGRHELSGEESDPSISSKDAAFEILRGPTACPNCR